MFLFLLSYIGSFIDRCLSLYYHLYLTTEDEMVGWHHRLDGHVFEQALRIGDGQGSLACCSPRGHKESDITDPLN